MPTCEKCGTNNVIGSKFCSNCGAPLPEKGKLIREQISPTSFKDVRKPLEEVLEGQYEIIDEIGRGGMAIVYKAIDLNLERVDAIKVLPVELAYDKEFVERFHREAKMAARLHHPNIITIYAVKQHENLNFMIMKYIDGKPLKKILKEQKTLPVEKSIHILKDVCSALFFAHKEGVIHRDIKPDNIMIDRHDNAIVMDFGIAKAATSTGLTTVGGVIGTAKYMSPEQIKGEADNRSDLYSLGIVAYRMLTGRVPFTGEDNYTINYKHLHDPPEPPSKYNPAIPKKLEGWILKLLEKNPNHRYQSAREALDVLEEIEYELKKMHQDISKISKTKPASTTEEINAYFKEGLAAFNQGEYERAISLWEKLLSIDPSYIKGIEYIQKAKQKIEDQQTIAQLMHEAKEYYQAGNYPEAIRCWGKVVALDAEQAEAFEWMEKARAKMSHLEKIEKLFLQGDDLLSKGEIEQAKEKFQKVLQLDPEHKEAMLMIEEISEEEKKSQLIGDLVARGDQAYNNREFERALQLYEEIFSSYPDHLATVKKVDQVKDAIRIRDHLDYYIEQAKKLADNKEYEQALKLWEEIVFVSPDNEEAKNNLESVKQLFERQKFVTENLSKAQESFEQGDYAQAIKLWEAVLNKRPEDKQILDKIFEAQKLLEKSQRLSKLREKGLQLFNERNYEEAYPILDEAYHLDPHDKEIFEAHKETKHILKVREIKQLTSQGKQCLEQGDYSEAVRLFHRILQLDPQQEQIAQLRNQASEKLEKERLKEMLLLKAKSLLKEKKIHKAKSAIEELIELEPENEDARQIQQEIEELAGQIQASEPEGEDAEAKEALFMGIESIIAGQAHLAKEYLQDALEIEPNNQRVSKILRSLGEFTRLTEAGNLVDVNMMTTIETYMEEDSSFKKPIYFEEVAGEVGKHFDYTPEAEGKPLLCQSPSLERIINPPQADDDIEYTEMPIGEHTSLYVPEEQKDEEAQEIKLPFKERTKQTILKNPILLLVAFIIIAGSILAAVLIKQGIEHRRLEYIRDLFTQAQTAFAQGQFQTCVIICENILQEDPQHLQTKSLKAEAMARIEEKKEKERIDNLIKTNLRAAEEAMSNKDPEQAIKLYDQILEVVPDNEVAKLRREEAVAAYEKLQWERNQKKMLEEKKQEAKKLFEEGNWQEAIETIEVILEKSPGEQEMIALKEKANQRLIAEKLKETIEGYRESAKKAFENKQYSNAVHYMNKVLEYHPDDQQAKELIAEAKRIMAERAARLARNRRINDLINVIESYIASNRFDDAIAKAEELRPLWADKADELAEKTLKTKARVEAERKLQAKIEDLLSKAKTAYSNKEYQKTIRYANDVLALQKDNPDAINLVELANTAIANLDITAPTIQHTQPVSEAIIKTDIEIIAKVEDDKGELKSVTLHWKHDGDTKFHTIDMYKRGGAAWRARISKRDNNQEKKIIYYITAQDPAGNKSESSKYTIEITAPVIPGPW